MERLHMAFTIPDVRMAFIIPDTRISELSVCCHVERDRDGVVEEWLPLVLA